MVKRSAKAVLLFILALVLCGCMVEKSVYQKKADEAENLSREVAALKQQNRSLADENENLKLQVQKLLAEKEDLEPGVRPAREAKPVAEERISEPGKEKPAAASAVPAPEGQDPQAIRIKVLSGNGKMTSARKMARRLANLGYRVESTGLASTPDYGADTVYYRKGLEKEASDMTGKLGAKTVTKPLTWTSVFDIIVVAVK